MGKKGHEREKSVTWFVKEEDLMGFMGCLDLGEKVEIKHEGVEDDKYLYYTIKTAAITTARHQSEWINLGSIFRPFKNEEISGAEDTKS